MKIIGIVDLHGDTGHAERLATRVADADLLLLGGDLTNFGRADDAADVIASLQPCAPKVLAVLGNVDYPEARQGLIDQGVNLDCSSVQVHEVDCAGVGGSTPCPGKTPNEYTEAEFASHWRAALADVGGRPLIMVSHQPPVDTVVDRVPDGNHVGSPTVRSLIEEHQPLVCLSGHIHEGNGVDRIGKTQLVNPGPFMRGRFATIEIENGEATVSVDTVGD